MNQLEKVHSTLKQLAKGENLQWFIYRKNGYLLRLTNNYIHQSGYQDETLVSLRVMRGGRMGLADTSDLSFSGLNAAMKSAERAMQIHTEKDPLIDKTAAYVPAKINDVLPRVNDYFSGSRAFSSEEASRKMKKALECIKQLAARAHGYFSNYEWEYLAGNTKGLKLSHRSTGAKFGITVNRGIGSGYKTFYHPDVRKIDFLEMAEEALKHACVTEREIKIKPGRYTVILSPRALASFFSNFLEEWNGLRFQEKESFLIHYKKKPLAAACWNVTDDVSHPLQTGIPFDVEGDKRKKVVLIKSGKFGECVYDRWTAMRYGVKSTGHGLSLTGEQGGLPYNIVVAGGKQSLNQMIQNTERGIFIPNIWYHQLVNPSHWIVTGLTRGGAAWIENGKIAGGLGRIRYLDGLLEALKRTSCMSREQHALKVRDLGALVFPYIQIKDLKII